MAAKKHILVPQHFTTENLATGFNPEEFPHIDASERDDMLRDGSLERLGDSGRIWKLKPDEARFRDASSKYGNLYRILARRGFASQQDWLDFIEVYLDEIRRHRKQKVAKRKGWVSNAIRPIVARRPQVILVEVAS